MGPGQPCSAAWSYGTARPVDHHIDEHGVTTHAARKGNRGADSPDAPPSLAKSGSGGHRCDREHRQGEDEEALGFNIFGQSPGVLLAGLRNPGAQSQKRHGDNHTRTTYTKRNICYYIL